MPTPSDRELTVSMRLEGKGSISASGPHDLVLRVISEFRDEVRNAPTVHTADSKDGEVQTTDHTPRADERPVTPERLPALSPFLKLKDPKNNPEAVAVMVVWENRKNSTTEFTIKSITDLWRASGRKTPGNIARDISEAAREGWIDKADRGKYVPSTFGEEFVDSLPKAKS